MATGHAPNASEDFKRLGKLMLFGFRAGPKRYRKLLVLQCIAFGFFIVFWIKFNGGLVPQFLFSQSESTDVSPDVDALEHFQLPEKDGSRLTWLHAVNSKDSLQRALNSDAMMLEADILLKGQDTDQQQLVAIMAHPPTVDSDVTLEEWLQEAAPSGKGLKLDFKSIEAVEISLQKLQSLKTKLRGPVYLSANVLEGPNAGASKVVDPHRFLRLCNSAFPQSTVSLGWTTGPLASGEASQYSWAAVKTMHDLVDKWDLKQPLSFSVRAAFVKNSLAQLKWLTEMTGGTLTVWGSPEDEVAVSELLLLRHKFPKQKVLYDLHESLQLQFQPAKGEVETRLSDDEKARAAALFRADMWKVVKTKGGEVIYMGNDAVLLQKGLLVTKEMYASPFSITGRLEFLPISADADTGDSAPGLEIYVLVTQSSRPDTLSGIKCFVGADGTTRLSTQGMPGVDRRVEGSVLGDTSCYMFTLTNKGGSHLTMTVMRQKTCDSHSTAYDGQNMLQLSMAGITQGAGHVAIKTAAGKAFVAIDHFTIGDA